MTTETSPALRTLGPYETRGELGRGGMAIVYQGVQPSLNRPVAIKVLPEQFAAQPELLARFEREGTIIAQLNHPNIVQVIDRGRQGSTLYIVMEYIDGGGLDTRLAGGPLPWRDVLDWSVQICDALDYAHSVGVVHRDLKPSNILIEMRSRRAKITDFGIAQLETNTAGLATLTMENTSIGTLNYMSPEQRLDAHRVDHRTDIFAFGVILYQMLTGKLPIGHFKLPSFLRPDVPMGLDAVVTRCLAEAPDERYQSAAEIRDDLLRFTGRDTGTATHTASLAPAGCARSRRWLWCALAVGVLCLVSVAAVAVVVARRQQATAASSLASSAVPRAEPPGAPASPVFPEPAAAAPSSPPAAAAASVATPSPPVAAAVTVAPPSPPATPVSALETDLARARGLIGTGSYTEAAAVLANMVSQNPHDPLAADAQFALAAVCQDMGDLQRAVTEYATLIRDYPASPRVPEAVVEKCRSEWALAAADNGKTVPVIGHVFRAVKKVAGSSRSYPAELQRRLVAELQPVADAQPASPHAGAALQLIVTICSPPGMGDKRLAADSLVRICRLNPATGADPLFEAATLYERELGEPQRAADLYAELLERFPNDPRTESVRARHAALRAAAAVPVETTPP